MRTAALLTLGALMAGSCDPGPPASGPSDWHAAFAIDAPLGGESLVCTGFDARALAGRVVRAVAWQPPADAALVLHHATLYAVPSDAASAPLPCELPPQDGVGLGVWLPGGAGGPLLPSDVGIVVPPGTRALVVQAHALRTAPGVTALASVDVQFWDAPPPHAAAFLAAYAAVPSIPAHTTASARAACAADAALHVVAVWPHMHRTGRALHASFGPASDVVAPLVDVDPWDFLEQRGYAADATLAAGDVVHVACDWDNTTNVGVVPGPYTQDEMCTLGLLVWPADAARWAPGGCQ